MPRSELFVMPRQSLSRRSKLMTSGTKPYVKRQPAGSALSFVIQSTHEWQTGTGGGDLPGKAGRGRIEALRQLTQQPHVPWQHDWKLQGHGVKCQLCGLHIKSCSTHAEISGKRATSCPGTMTKTLNQLMSELIDATEVLPEDQAGHRWYMKASSFSCNRCWVKVPRRCGKEALQSLQAKPCICAQVQEHELQLRTRLHPSHVLWQRGDWLECQKCKKITKVVDGRVQGWLGTPCLTARGQQTLRFAPTSSDS